MQREVWAKVHPTKKVSCQQITVKFGLEETLNIIQFQLLFHGVGAKQKWNKNK